MRKHEEGYTLVMVLIVMLVMCTVAISVLSVSTANLRKQQDSLARMEDRYKAAGAVEEAVALIGTKLKQMSDEFDAQDLAEILDEERVAYSEPVWYDEEQKESVVVHLKAQSGNTAVECDLLIAGVISETGQGSFSITGPELSYASYEVYTETSAEGGASE